MPQLLQDLIQQVRPQMSKPDAVLNSCLVTRYKNESDHIPPHRDDEPLINPDSEIVTVTIGSNRTMKFVDNSGQQSKDLILDNKSVLVSSRKAQDFWKHSIERSDIACDVRFSFTFRHRSKPTLHFKILLGDDWIATY